MDIVLFIVIMLIASIIQSSTGFGFSIFATPFLLLIFEPIEAIQINLILSFLISMTLISQIRKGIDYEILKRLIFGNLIGLPIGVVAFLLMDVRLLKLFIGCMIVGLTILLVLKLRMSQTKGKDLVTGGISGALTTSVGMPGPPLLLYFSGANIEKEKLRSTTLAYYLFIYPISLVVQLIFVETNATIWISSGLALPLVFIGLYLGQLLFKWLSPRVFRIITYVILLFTGVYMLVESVG